MALIDDVKQALRISSSAMDTEISDLIAACMYDLNLSGASNINSTDPLVKRAIITYCKAYFGYDNPDADRFIASYNLLKNYLAIASEYHTYPEVEA